MDRIPSKTVVWMVVVVVVVAVNFSEPQSDDMKIQVYPSQMLEQTHYSTNELHGQLPPWTPNSSTAI